MVSNVMFDIFGNFRISTKCLTLDPLFVVEILLKKESHCLNQHLCTSEDRKSCFWEIGYQCFWNQKIDIDVFEIVIIWRNWNFVNSKMIFREFETLELWNVETLELWNLETLTSETLKFWPFETFNVSEPVKFKTWQCSWQSGGPSVEGPPSCEESRLSCILVPLF